MSEDEEFYESLADEFNDFADDDPDRPSEDDFDPEAVAGAKRYAAAHKLRWPPHIGDFDRYHEWKRSGTYPLD